MVEEYLVGAGPRPETSEEYVISPPQENPNDGLGIAAIKPQQPDAENPNGCTKKTPTARPRHIGRTRSGTRCAYAYSADFSRVWEIYPRQIGKAEALAAWQELAPGPELVARILAAVEVHTESEQWTRSLAEDGGRYIPKLATFLGRRQWEDAPAAKREPEAAKPAEWDDPDDSAFDAFVTAVREAEETP